MYHQFYFYIVKPGKERPRALPPQSNKQPWMVTGPRSETGCRLSANAATSGALIGARQYLWPEWFWAHIGNNKVKLLFWLRGWRFRVWTCFSSRYRGKRRREHINLTIQRDYTLFKSRESTGRRSDTLAPFWAPRLLEQRHFLSLLAFHQI